MNFIVTKAKTKTQAFPPKKPPKQANNSPPREKQKTIAPRARAKADPDVLKKFEKKLQKQGIVRKEAEEKHKAEVKNMFDLALDALEAGLPMAVVAGESGMSRQWLYKGKRMRENPVKPRIGRPKDEHASK